MHYIVHRFKDVCHQELLVVGIQLCFLELLLSIHCTLILLVIEAESAGGLGFFNHPVLVDKEFEEQRGLLANVALEVLVHLYDYGLASDSPLSGKSQKRAGRFLVCLIYLLLG